MPKLSAARMLSEYFLKARTTDDDANKMWMKCRVWKSVLASFENVGVTGVQNRMRLVRNSEAATDKIPYGMWQSSSALSISKKDEAGACVFGVLLFMKVPSKRYDAMGQEAANS